ncbi:7SK snRNA methylphosphate capping enzyme-like [Gouania willdenowi]|uniref:RNA methyltransferase n=1 Tax=Gouania willdenowi TaxID=441366 RepID=A0A8C5GQ89_GOUWI|nr:7SK snRNA methylphosphate capping enzyme-like [Gouania willdenowi]XP_028297796.1 7SK snRNA methylphosphate capping enzyme-like [Gouania willdenowi]
MSVDEESVKSGGPEASSASNPHLSGCNGAHATSSGIMEVISSAPDPASVCPVLDAASSPNATSITDALNLSDSSAQRSRANENNINRRNSFNPNKQQQQQQQTRLTKRRNTANFNFKHPVYGKRRRRANSESDSVLPTKFHLGGNIFDPLNLNSLQDEEVNRALNAETPKSSPLPAKSRDPVEILIPRDITDPLNLNSGLADSSFLSSPHKSGGRKRHRNRHHGGGGISTTQTSVFDLAKCDSKTGTATLPPTDPDSSALEVSKDSNSFSNVTGSSHEQTSDTSTSCKEEPASASLEESTSVQIVPGQNQNQNQHTSRRKRRRNSGKTEPPINHSTPIGKPGPGDRSQRSSLHMPRNPRTGPGGSHPNQRNHNQKKEQKKKFQFGNYNKYYGYRNPGCSEDPRVRVFLPEWFEGKEVLDLGCNTGHITLYIAKMLRPARILGLDIDADLVHVARKNIRHFLSELQAQEARHVKQEKNKTMGLVEGKHKESESRDENAKPAGDAVNDSNYTNESGTQTQESKAEETKLEDAESPPADQPLSCTFPVSLRISRGPIAAPPLTETPAVTPGEFPSNVSFIKANYVLDNDHLLVTQRPEYDVILCLSVTKWVHLNWGDPGLCRFFKRVYKHLRPGGMFILEPQPWESYVRRKKLTDNIRRNYLSIQLKPDQFSSFLINEVGFTSFEHLGAPKCSVRGFERPIYVFHK